MNRNIYLIVACFFGMLIFSCEESSPGVDSPYNVIIEGVTEVEPGVTNTYYIGDVAGAEGYVWSITGPGSIVGDNSGSSIDVFFESVGEVVLSITNSSDGEGSRIITVEEVVPEVSVTLNGYGVLKDGSSDTVFLSFPAPLSSIGVIKLLSATESSYFSGGSLAFSSGSLSGLTQVDNSHFYAVYTAGSGNGTPEAMIDTLTAAENYGSLGLEDVYLQMYRVDNTVPLGALNYSSTLVNDSTTVTITATFSEPIDPVALLSFSGAGVAVQTDTLKATADPLVYTYDYVVNGEGNGMITVGLEDVVDEAGNELGGISGSLLLEVDNVAPVIGLNAVGGSGVATLELSSMEPVVGWYVVLDAGEAGPTEVGDVSEFAGVAAGSIDLESEDQVPMILSAGTYDVYFAGMDDAGNYSTIEMTTVTVD